METDAVRDARLAKAHAAMSGGSKRARRNAVISISALGGAEAYQPLLAALRDPDRKVRFNAVLGLAGHDAPEAYAEDIVVALAAGGAGPPDAVAARELIDLRVGPGVLTRLGIAARLLPAIERLAREGDGWRRRRQAAWIARGLRGRLDAR